MATLTHLEACVCFPVLGVLLAAAGLTGCETGASGGGCRPAAALAPAANPVAPRPKKVDSRPVCTPSTSKVWKSFKPHRGNIKTNGEPGSKRRYYRWDYTHGDIEVFDRKGRHLGSMDPATGIMTKPPVPGRRIDV